MGRSKRPSKSVSSNSVRSGHKTRLKKANFLLNPFTIFSSRFLKSLKSKQSDLSDTECATIADKLWKHMDETEKEPFVTVAQDFKYVYQSKNRNVNWFIQNLGHLMPGGRIDLRVLKCLASTVTNWNKKIMGDIMKDM